MRVEFFIRGVISYGWLKSLSVFDMAIKDLNQFKTTTFSINHKCYDIIVDRFLKEDQIRLPLFFTITGFIYSSVPFGTSRSASLNKLEHNNRKRLGKRKNAPIKDYKLTLKKEAFEKCPYHRWSYY